jgi:DNA-binding transcriptional ArsR family regulator
MSSVSPGARGRAAARDLVPVFAALGDSTRLALLTKLSDGDTRSITELAADTQLTRQAITKHLRVLESAGLVASSRVGRESQFAFRPAPLNEAQSYLAEVSQQWDAALSRLRSFVER